MPTERPQDTREALLDAAETLFGERGYAAVGIREIVERADVNIAAIKYYFGSKSDLYVETVRRAMKRSGSDEVWNILIEKPRTPPEAAAALARFTHRFLERIVSQAESHSACGLIAREAAEPSEAMDAVIRDFIRPHQQKVLGVMKSIAPQLPQKALVLHVESLLAQILHFRMFRAIVERTIVADLSDDATILRVARHIAQTSLKALGCGEDLIAGALERIDEHVPQETGTTAP